MTLTGIKVGHVRADGAGEFARSSTFKAYCKKHIIVIEEVPAYTHTFMLELKVPFAFVRTRYARFCAVRTCLAVFGLMRYFIGVVLTPTGPTPAVIPRGKRLLKARRIGASIPLS
jgi:hypothetical protein